MAIGKEIRKELDRQGHSVAWLSKTSGIKATTLRSIISRDSWNIQEDQLNTICVALGLKPHELLGVKTIQLSEDNMCSFVQLLLDGEFQVARDNSTFAISNKNKRVKISEKDLNDCISKTKSFFSYLIFEKANI